jgi:NitT/TauT family transport system permease protein
VTEYPRRPARPAAAAALWTAAGTAALIALWALAARALGSELVLPGPLAVLRRLAALAGSAKLWLAVAGSLGRVAWSLVLAVPLAVAAGLAAGRLPAFGAFVRPLFAVVSATPVLAVILIALLVFGQESTPVFAAFLMLFPVMAGNVVAGSRAVDRRLAEAARIYGFTRFDRIIHLYWPSLAPYLAAGLRATVSLAWKVVVAAEVLAQPRFSLGAGMQSAKAQLETAELFAWTVATILLAGGTEALFSRLELALKRRGATRGA